MPTPEDLRSFEEIYCSIMFGYDEPEYMIIRTPHGPVQITSEGIDGSQEAIAWVKKTYLKH